MVSPVLNEDAMMQALRMPETTALLESTERLRIGAGMLLVDAFDRKVTRDHFLAALGAATSLIDAVARHEAVHSVKLFEVDHGNVTKADIETALDSLHKMIANGVAQCHKMADLLRQCPLDEDRLN